MRHIVTVRGKLRETDERKSRQVHDRTVDKVSPTGRSLGSTGHTAYLNMQNRREFLAIDRWESLEGLQKFMSDPNTAAELGQLFEGPPEVTIWAEADWRSY